MKTILVTGGAGYIGSIVVRRLLEEKYSVIILDNLSRGHKESIPQMVTFVEGNIGDEKLVTNLLKKYPIDIVMHFAAFAYVGESVEKPEMYIENNVTQGLVFLECLKEAGIKKIIFSSSCVTYGSPEKVPITEETPQKPMSPYGYSKYLFERALQYYDEEYGIKFVALRYFNAAGAAYGIGEDHKPETHIIPLALDVALGKRKHFELYGTDYPTKDGTCIRDYVHVLDLAQVHLLAIKEVERGHSTFYNLGSEKGYSNKEVLEVCREVTKHSIPVQEKARRPGDPAMLYASFQKAKKELGWKPKYVLKEIIQSAWNWHKNNPKGYE